ncbi:DUF6126 family protein [Streptomyces sp. NPDC020681]|uniref:DUF6126 family protein n=1 Tax=Streptomyces sp. NPDC020681 TaxID=3365083 RepID=UPI0037B8397A
MSDTPERPAVSKLSEPSERNSEHNEEGKFPRGLVIRLFAYLVAGHLFAGFLYLLFTLGGKG